MSRLGGRGRGFEVEVEVKKSRSRLKSRGRGFEVEVEVLKSSMASRFGQKVVEFKNPRRKGNCWSRRTLIEFQQVLSEFSNCRPRKKNPGREFTKKKLAVENSQKKKLPVEN